MTLNKKLLISFSTLVLIIIIIIIPLLKLNSDLTSVSRSLQLASRNNAIAERINASSMFIKSSRNQEDEKTAREELNHQFMLLKKSLLVLSEGGDAPEMNQLIVIKPAGEEQRYAIGNVQELLHQLDSTIYKPMITEPITISVKISRRFSLPGSTEIKTFSSDSLIENPTFKEAFSRLIQQYNQNILLNACTSVTDRFAARYNSLSASFNNYLYFSIFAILLCVTIVSFVIIRMVKRPLAAISDVAKEMAGGNVSRRISHQSNDEIGDIARHINHLSQTIQHTASFITAVGNGDFNATYQVEVNTAIDEKNNLPLATLNMRDKLRMVSEEETKRNWVTAGLARLSEINRSLDSTDEKMYDTYLQFIVKYMNANQGGLFIINDDNEMNPVFNLVACIAYGRKKYQEKELALTEGLIGQCYLENDIVYITDLPQTHLTITSGLGESMPRCLILLPLKTNDKTIGVIELASFEEMDQYKLEFLKKTCESIATLIVGLKSNIKTNRLLQQTQQQTEEMRAQEEEMRQNMEELTATQEELDRKRLEMDSRMDAINRSIATIEFSTDGTIMTANDKFLKLFKYSLPDLTGKHHSVFLEPAQRNTPEQLHFWESLKNGNNVENQFRYIDADASVIWLSGIYAPIFDRHNTVVKIIFFARDITAQKTMG